MQAYQERVISEKAELDEKIEKLRPCMAGWTALSKIV